MRHITLKSSFQEGFPTRPRFDRCADWIVVLPAEKTAAAGRGVPHMNLLLRRYRAATAGKARSEPFVTDAPNALGSRVAMALVKAQLPQFELLTLARKLVAVATARRARRLGVLIGGPDRERIAEALYAAALAAAASLPSYKSGRNRDALLAELAVYGIAGGPTLDRTRAEAEGNALARALTIEPSNHLTPAIYLQQVRELAREYGWQMRFHDVKALARLKAGAFLAVAQGSPDADAGIVWLRYDPRGARSKTPAVALVGKGICYDTGGTNLKPAQFMYGMHGDMQGSAVALGILQALTELRVGFAVECWLALAMNHIGPRAYKPNDIVTAMNGVSIEVVHTDAEGRMVLADTLALACRNKPRLLLDYATLTSDCKRALGSYMSGVFTNRDEWNWRLVEAGRQCGERVWPFPLERDYDQALESDIADIKQCTVEGHADHIHAARFLQRFVDRSVPWIHMDLSSGGSKGGLGHVATQKTGFGVRFTVSLLLDQKLV